MRKRMMHLYVILSMTIMFSITSHLYFKILLMTWKTVDFLLNDSIKLFYIINIYLLNT